MLGLSLSLSSAALRVVGDVAPASPVDFVTAAARVLNRNSPGARASVVDGSNDVTFTIYDTASTINGASLTGGGVVDERDMPPGYSFPIRGKWILTSAQDPIDPTPNQTFAPGMSTTFIFEGQVFEFKGGVLGTGAFAMRWSDDGGKIWKQIYRSSSDDQHWYQFDFGSAATRIVEVIGCSQTIAINGFNFDTGPSVPAAWTDVDLPLVTMFGDSYVFGQNADDLGPGQEATDGDDQNAVNGMTRKLGEYLGCLQVRNQGLRGNHFSPADVAVGGGYQAPTKSNYADRLSGGAYPDFAEAALDLDAGGVMRDLFVIPSTVNDDALKFEGKRRAEIAKAFRRLRQLQPNCMILFPVGARAPQWGEGELWLEAYQEGFRDVFGQTEAEWIANGAYLHDGSRRDGANWIPAGAEGSSPFFGDGVVNGDSGHPTAAGHDYLAGKYAEGAIYLAEQIAIAAVKEGYGTELWQTADLSVDGTWVDNGDGSYSKPAGSNFSLSLVSDGITDGEVYVISLDVDPDMVGELRVRMFSGTNEILDAPGSYSFIQEGAANGRLIVQGLINFGGTIRNVSCRRLV